jgi:transcriptional regulator with XRE-family HTH domain
MSNNVKRRLTAPKGRQDEVLPLVESKNQTFAKRLYHALLERGMTQSDLARKIWNETRVDNRGYDQTVGKDRVSSWIRGRSMPEPHNLIKIAKALNMSPEDLAPNLTASAIEQETPEIQITVIHNHPNKVLVKLNKILPFDVATKIMNLVNEANQ